MTRKRFDHPNDVLADQQGYAGAQLPDGVTIDQAAEELYSRIGERFTVSWESWSPAEPVIDTNDLPAGVSESDVESALSSMKTDGFL